MKFYLSKIFKEMAPEGVLHREGLKNYPKEVKRLERSGLVAKAYRRGRVFYELTPKALPLLEHCRRQLVEEAQLRARMEPRSFLYRSLLEDLRFVDERRPEASEFRFLGDWQLTRPVVVAQLLLSQQRFYQKRGL